MPNQWFENLDTDLRFSLLDFAEQALQHHNGNLGRAAQDCQAKFALEPAHARFAVKMPAPVRSPRSALSGCLCLHLHLHRHGDVYGINDQHFTSQLEEMDFPTDRSEVLFAALVANVHT